jgi:hypothetical protein
MRQLRRNRGAQFESLEPRKLLSAVLGPVTSGLSEDNWTINGVSGRVEYDLMPLYVTADGTATHATTPGVDAFGLDVDGIADLIITRDDGVFRGSGSLLWTGRHILTAAHCVTAIGSPGLPGAVFGSFKFTPGQYGARSAAPYGTWTATSLYAPPEYREYGYSSADWAFLILPNIPENANSYIGDVTSWFYIHSDPPGGTKYSYGYPAEGTFASNSEAICNGSSCKLYYCASRVTDVNSQYTQTLIDPSVSYGGWWEVGFGCFMTGGSSGGPVFEQIDGTWYATGVNSHLQTTADKQYSCTTRLSGLCPIYSYNYWSPYFNARVIEAWFNLAVQ